MIDRFRFLATHNAVGTSHEDIAPGVRLYSAGAYVIYFYPTTQGVSIAAIFHGARDHGAIFSRGIE